jgi:peptidoglycan/LPS O-acetylase OafA/YrhL
MPETIEQVDPREIAFRRVVMWFTALSLGAAYGWLAGFVQQGNGDLTFQWRWLIPVWAFIGTASTIYFWHKVWPPENQKGTRRGIVLGVIALALPCLWWLILPLRSQSGQHLWQVVEGLTAAILVLTFGGWMIFRLGRAFEDDKEAE